jgi:hypothetical protein
LAVQWILFMSYVNHSSGGRLVQSFLGSERMWRGESYMKLVEVKEKHVFANGEKSSSCLLLTRMCGICLEFHNNQLRTKVPLKIFSS